MGRPLNKLTALQVKSLGPGHHADGGGLYLQVTDTGARSWVFRFMIDGKRREMGLGSVQTVTLKRARELAMQRREARLNGDDPIEARRAEMAAKAKARQKALTFDECMKAYFEAQSGSFKSDVHKAQWISTITADVSPVIGKLPVNEIDQALVLEVLKPIWWLKTITADRVRLRIEKVLDWAKSRGLREGDNPARWKDNLAYHLPSPRKITKTKHLPALRYEDLPDFMTLLKGQTGLSVLCLEFVLLTAVRASGATAASWSEFDLPKKTWTIPGVRMKTDKEHSIPLSDRALEIISVMKDQAEGQWVFPGGRKGEHLTKGALLALIERMGMKGRITTHGFRTTFRTWAADKMNFEGQVVEMCLSHSNKDKVEAAYMRTTMFDKRAVVMQAWSDFVQGNAKTSVDVVDLSRYRRSL